MDAEKKKETETVTQAETEAKKDAEKTGAAVLEATGLRKTFRDFWGRPRTVAVESVSLRASPGEVVGLLGPNGSGKSTTIKMILGLLRPTAGTVRLFGLPPGAPRARARTGYLPELSNLHRFLTPRETLGYYAGLFGMPGPAARSRIAELLRRVGLDGAAADRPVGEFSKGMARRVGIAQALLNDPEFVVLDEPTSGLDPVGRREVKDLVRGLGAEGRTVLLSSHLLAEAEDVCTRVAILAGGRVRAEGRLSDLLERRDAVRFTATGLAPERAADFRAQLEAAGAAVAVDRPARTLENYFLEIVREAGAAGASAPDAGRGAGT